MTIMKQIKTHLAGNHIRIVISSKNVFDTKLKLHLKTWLKVLSHFLKGKMFSQIREVFFTDATIAWSLDYMGLVYVLFFKLG